MKAAAMILVVALGGGEALAVTVPPRLPQPSRRDTDCAVPNLIGLDQGTATSRLQQSRLRLGQLEERRSPQRKGTVIAQRPQPCGSLSEGPVVHLVVSSGQPPGETATPGGGSGVGDVAVPIAIGAGAAIVGAIIAARRDRTTEVPDLLTKTVPAAEQLLGKSRLKIGEVASRASARAAGSIIDQKPPAGTRVARDTPVSVTVSSGLPMTEVPDLIDRPRGDAEALVTQAQLRMLTPNQAAPIDPQSRVVSQVPAAGTQVVVGAAVAVTLAAPVPAAAPVLTPQEPPVAAAGPPPQAPVRAPVPTPAPPAPPAATAPPVANPVVPAVPSTAAPPPAIAPPPVPLVTDPAVAPPPQAAPVAEPATPALPVASFSRWWLWLLLLLPVVARMARRTDRTPENSEREPFTLPPPRVVVLPRIDAGHQVITTLHGGEARTFDIAYRLDPGVQQVRVHPPGRAGAES